MYSFYSFDYLNNVDYFVKCNYSNISNYCIVLNNSNKNINDNFLTKFDYNFFNILTFILFSLFSLFGLLFYLGKNHQNNIINFINYYSNNVEYLDYDIFLFEYFEEFNDLNKKELNDNDFKQLKYNFIKVNTRFGEIVLNYDYKNYGFNYYCKKSNSYSFEYLESVSRIYVVNYDCKNIYVCEDDEYDDDNDGGQDNDNNKDEGVEGEKEEKSVFFNRKNKKNSLVDKFINGKNKEIISNKYKYKGNIEKFAKICKFHDYNIIQNDLKSQDVITDAGFYDYKIDFFKLEKNKNNKIIDNSNNIIKNKKFFIDLLKSDSNINTKEEMFENLETQSNISDFSDISSFEELIMDDKKTKNTFLSFKDFKKIL